MGNTDVWTGQTATSTDANKKRVAVLRPRKGTTKQKRMPTMATVDDN